MAHVGLCEDDPAIRRVVSEALKLTGHTVTAAHDGGEALRRFADDDSLEVIVLDIGLPDSDGRDVCQALRSRGMDTPVLFLTARDQLHDVLAGFAAGGDDHMPKPFHVSELLARVGAMVRRGQPRAAAVPTGLHLDPADHALSGPDGRQSLTPTEFRLLAALMASTGSVIRRRNLVLAAWPDGAFVADNTLDQYMTRLRKKVTAVGDDGRRIGTVHGVGYRFT
jgi:two-component system response regulator MprA